ncbi:TonB-dependent receptor [Dokdonella fugitiva]|jgi:outer membrane receptor protein involved in Fe transport|uniref:TonB-dependent receptor-like protein n=1 Tax=Dokdonella fugitiva TaxID=328517 RepID=A0A4V2S2K5_9GAMM|nr:TonB-dependent receptor [Dokdonella fugitiva]TCO40850.1 TonB-dependent receptor-like protein [Dokdonella fugitiva]
MPAPILKKKLLAAMIASAVVATSALPTLAWAQTADANLRGKAPANSEITARNVATGAVRRTKASAEGAYSLVGLPPGTYQVDAGAGTARTVTLTVASTATLDLAAAPTGTPTTTLEGITVTAQVLTEVKTSEVGNTVSLHRIQTVPQITRNFLEFADTVPGMVFSTDPSGHTKLTGGGQSANNTNVFIDGVGQKNYVKEGGVAGQFNSQGNPFPQLAIGEYKVITSNYKAEYDQISSAAVTAETKSGTNEFHGEVFHTYTDQDWRSSTPAEDNAHGKIPSMEKEYGIALGGPIIRDAMHFFFTYEAKRFDTPITVVPGTTIEGGDIRNLLPANVAAEFGPADLPFTEDLYFGKIDWEFSDRDRFEISSKVRKEDQADNIGTSQARSASILVKNNDTRIDARWQHSADSWYNELLASWEKTYNAPTPLNAGNGYVYTLARGSDDATIVSTAAASPLATQNKGQKGPSIQDNLTFSDLNWMGNHTVKLGAKYKKVDLTAQDAADVNPQFTFNVGPEGTADTPYKAFFTSPVPGLDPVARSADKQFGAYIQDDWEVNDHLTLNLGVRWDYEDNSSYLDHVTPANVIAALNSPNPDPNAPPGQTYADALRLGGVDINDYISNGHNRSAYKGEWQPRLGFSYDIGADEQHVIFGGAGRAYDRDLYDYLQLEQTKSALPQFTVWFRDPLTGQCRNGNNPCFDWDPNYLNGLANLQALVAASNVGSEVDMINNHLKVPYSDQFSLGMRNALGDWNTSAAVSRILSKNGFVFTLGNRYPNGAFWMNGGQPWGNGVPGFGALIIGNNGIETKTTQVLLSAEKPYTRESGWSASIAYTYTNAKQNRDINEHYAFDGETIGDYPFITSNAAARHRLVATGSIDGPWGFLFSGKITLATPIPHNDIGCFEDPNRFFPSGAHCGPVASIPGGQDLGFGGHFLGYRSLDLQATKNFDLSAGLSAYIRIDFLNVFNFKNYNDVLVSSNGTFSQTVAIYNPVGNITGVPRTMKVTAGFRF